MIRVNSDDASSYEIHSKYDDYLFNLTLKKLLNLEPSENRGFNEGLIRRLLRCNGPPTLGPPTHFDHTFSYCSLAFSEFLNCLTQLSFDLSTSFPHSSKTFNCFEYSDLF